MMNSAWDELRGAAPASPEKISKEIDSVADSEQRYPNFQGNDECCVNVNTSKEPEDECQKSLQLQANLPKMVLEERPKESDLHRIRQREKQIEYGRNTLGYKRYIEMVPREQRKKHDPQTPDVKQVCSKRSWDGQVQKWRRLLHHYDPPHHQNDQKHGLFLVGSRKRDNLENHDTNFGTIESKKKPQSAIELLQLYQDWVARKP